MKFMVLTALYAFTLAVSLTTQVTVTITTALLAEPFVFFKRETVCIKQQLLTFIPGPGQCPQGSPL